MEKIRCEICGGSSGRINPVCESCMKKANISKKTIEMTKELDKSIEILAMAAIDLEESGELSQKVQRLGRRKDIG